MKLTDLRKFTSSALPLTEMVKVEVLDKNKLLISATNLRNSVKIVYETLNSYKINGSFCIDLDNLLKIETLEEAIISIKEKKIDITVGRRIEMKLPIESSDDFPRCSSVEFPENSIMLSNNTITYLKRAANIASKDESMESTFHIMMSADIVAIGDNVMYVSTDATGLDASKQILIHPSVISLLESGMVLSETENSLVFKNNHIEIVQQKCNATFPAYRNAIPKSLECKICLSNNTLKEAVNFCLFTAHQYSSCIVFSVENDSLSLYSEDIAMCKSGTYVIPVESNFEKKFMLDGQKIQKYIDTNRPFDILLSSVERERVVVFKYRESNELTLITQMVIKL